MKTAYSLSGKIGLRWYLYLPITIPSSISLGFIAGGVLTIILLLFFSSVGPTRISPLGGLIVIIGSLLLLIPYIIAGYISGYIIKYFSIKGNNRNLPFAIILAILLSFISGYSLYWVFYEYRFIIANTKIDVFITVIPGIIMVLHTFFSPFISVFSGVAGVLSLKDKPFCENCKLWLVKTKLVKKFQIDQMSNLLDILQNNHYKNIIQLSSCKDDNEYCRLEYFKCPKCNTCYYDLFIKQSSEFFEKLIDSQSISGEILSTFEEKMGLLCEDFSKKDEGVLEEEMSLFEEQSKQLWRCPNCGELIECQFTTCWKCGTDRA